MITLRLLNKIILVLIPSLISFAISTAKGETMNSLTQYGITWTFSEPVVSGQFVNGDYWVVDPGNGVKIVNISPGYATHPTTGRALNGSMINPHTATQGYDGYQNYSASLNIGIGISTENPLVLSGGMSLVSTISNLDAGVGNKSYVNTASVLTCLSSAPATGSFRPGISSTNKTIHNASSINYNKLKSLSYPTAKPNLSTYADYLKMTWLTHDGGWTCRFMHPSASGLDNYYYAQTFSTAALLLHLDYTNAEKTPLLLNFIQLGIDIYSYIESGANGWAPDGGHSNGRKWPILFAGIILDYAPMWNIGQLSGDYLYTDGHGPGNLPAGYIHFGEDGQTFYVAQSDVNLTNGPTWNPDTRNHTAARYTSAMIGMPEWGIRYSTNPERSDASWMAEYRTIGSGPQAWSGSALSAYFMEAKTLWNHNAFFDYVDRYDAITKGLSDPFGFTVPDENTINPIGGHMWPLYRPTYPYSWNAQSIPKGMVLRNGGARLFPGGGATLMRVQ